MTKIIGASAFLSLNFRFPRRPSDWNSRARLSGQMAAEQAFAASG
jgi:hypothetical protein